MTKRLGPVLCSAYRMASWSLGCSVAVQGGGLWLALELGPVALEFALLWGRA